MKFLCTWVSCVANIPMMKFCPSERIVRIFPFPSFFRPMTFGLDKDVVGRCWVWGKFQQANIHRNEKKEQDKHTNIPRIRIHTWRTGSAGSRSLKMAETAPFVRLMIASFVLKWNFWRQFWNSGSWSRSNIFLDVLEGGPGRTEAEMASERFWV